MIALCIQFPLGKERFHNWDMSASLMTWKLSFPHRFKSWHLWLHGLSKIKCGMFWNNDVLSLKERYRTCVISDRNCTYWLRSSRQCNLPNHKIPLETRGDSLNNAVYTNTITSYFFEIHLSTYKYNHVTIYSVNAVITYLPKREFICKQTFVALIHC